MGCSHDIWLGLFVRLLPDTVHLIEVTPQAPQVDLLSPSTLAPIPRPQLPIEAENVFSRLLVTASDQTVEVAKPALT